MSTGKNQAQSLAYYFLTKVKGFPVDGQGRVKTAEGYKRATLEQCSQMLAGNMDPKEIQSVLESNAGTEEGKGAVDIVSLLRMQGIEPKMGQVEFDESNLLKPGRFYYHPELQQQPPLPSYYFDEDLMEAVPLPVEDFYFEMKEKYSFDDLCRFFFSRVPHEVSVRSRARGQLKKMLETVDLDFLLYLIDEGSAIAEQESRPKPMPFTLNNYYNEARQAYENRIEILIEEGLTHVIPRAT